MHRNRAEGVLPVRLGALKGLGPLWKDLSSKDDYLPLFFHLSSKDDHVPLFVPWDIPGLDVVPAGYEKCCVHSLKGQDADCKLDLPWLRW